MLTGRPARLVDRNGAPAGERHVLLVDPPVIDPASGARGSAGDPRPALGAAVPAGRAPDDRLRAVAGRGRDPADRPARVAARELRARAAGSAATAAATCRPSGGRSSAACATARSSASSRRTRSSSGVDIGRLDVSILAGYPGSVAATWQQFGRAGRRQGTSVAVLVASGAPVDQYVIHHPEFLLEGTPEEARLDPDNLHVLLAHLRAATFELPFEPGEVFGPGAGGRPARVPRRGGARPPGRATGAGTGRARTSRRRRSRCGPPRRRTS